MSPGVGEDTGRGRTPVSTSTSPREAACHPAPNSAKEIRGQTVCEAGPGGPGQARNSPVAPVPFQRHSSVLTAVPKVPESHEAWRKISWQ